MRKLVRLRVHYNVFKGVCSMPTRSTSSVCRAITKPLSLILRNAHAQEKIIKGHVTEYSKYHYVNM